MLEIRNVSKAFAKKPALQDVTLEILPGECFGLVGPNGAGKTTLINLITGFLTPDSGSIEIDGMNIAQENRQFKYDIGSVPQELALYENLSVVDNLKYFGELYGLSGNRLSGRIHELTHWVGLSDRKSDRVKTLSGGMKRRLNLIAGLLHAPKLLLVDEPTVGVDPEARLFIYDLITQLKTNGTTILYTTHYLPEVERLCDRAAILNHGQIVALKSREEILGKLSGNGFESEYFALTRAEALN